MKSKMLLALIVVVLITGGFWLATSVNQSLHTILKTSGAKKALDFWAAVRAYPAETIPNQGYFEAYQYAKQFMHTTRDSLPETDPWETIGPHNIGGRTNALAFNPQNPNTIYAGSASGGLWRSYTGGVGADAWDYVPTGFPVLGVGGIAIAPNDSNTIYIGTGEVYGYQDAQGGTVIRTTRGSYGIGILKTTDGGDTWSKSLDWTYEQKRGVWTIRINPQNPDVVWAATTEGPYKSTDGGDTWNLMFPAIMAMDLVINPQDPDIVFVGCGNLLSPGRGIYRTTDGGSTWTQLTEGLPTNFGGKIYLSMYPQSPNIVYASIGNGYSSGAGTWLCRTTDNGDTWQTMSTLDYATYQGWFAHIVAVSPVDPTLVITGGVDLYKSTNSGSNLQRKSYWNAWYFGVVPPGGPEGPPNYSHADHHTVAWHPTDPNIVYFGNDGGVFRSLDAGETFEGCNGGYQSTQFYNGFSCSYLQADLALGGMQDNATAIYEGTVAWRRVIGGDGCWTGISSQNDLHMYGSYQGLSMQKSTNGGYGWNSIQPPSSGTTAFVAPFVVAVDNPQVIYAGRSYIYKSLNGGWNWSTMNFNQQLDGRPALSMAVSPTNNDVVYVGTAPVPNDPHIFRTSNGGANFVDITPTTMPDRYPMDIAIDPTNDDVAYVVFGGFGSAHVMKTTDGGQSWVDMTNNLPDVPTIAITVDPLYPNHVYLGNDLGVFASTNGGGTWTPWMDGLPDAVMAMDLTISQPARLLRVATHGNGVFERALFDEPLAVDDDEFTVTAFTLAQNYPNPFNPSTTIAYRLTQATPVQLTVYNMAGQVVRTLVDAEQEAGAYETTWDGTNMHGEMVSSGTYLYRLEADGFVETKRMTFLK